MKSRKVSSSKSSFSLTKLAERIVQRRAVEAVLWGIPAVNYDRMLQAAIANGAQANQVVYWSRPVKQYWSATAYDRETHALIRETLRSSCASNSPDVQQNADGSVEIYFGPSAPAGKESNWVPTAGRDFEVLFRFYGPEKALFDKTWMLPDIEKMRKR